jgi:hypothetical protein
MEEAEESRGGRLGEGVILTRRGIVRRLCPYPILHYYQYVPLDCASGSVSGAKPRIAFQLRGKEKGRGNDVGPTCQRQQPYKLQCLFNFHLLFNYDMAEAPSSTFNPLHLLQLQSSSPLHPSSTSILLANFNPRRHSNSKPRRCAISSPSP